MRRSAVGAATLAVATGLTAAAWAEPRDGVKPDAVANHLDSNPDLASRLQRLLPPGTSLQSAASGFQSDAQFVAALHVSRNLRIPFSELKASMSRRRGADSLGRAIHDLRPDFRPKAVQHHVKVAERQAQTDLELSGELADAASEPASKPLLH